MLVMCLEAKSKVEDLEVV